MSDKKGDWQTMSGILTTMEEAHRRLLNGEATVDKAFAESRLFAVAIKTLDLRLHHAKLTGRLTEGSDLLPDVRISQSDGDGRRGSNA